MEKLDEAKQLISEAKNICIIPSENNEESISSALALFYTLKELGKNVNLLLEEFPEKLKFLLPSLDYISYPKNFVISIPQKTAEISQVYYEKNDEGLKIHLTLDKGNIKKDNISFYFSEAKPDATITLGLQDFGNELREKLNPYGFLLDSPVINIDNRQDNKNFGKINIIQDSALADMALSLVKNPHIESIKEKAALCFLAGIAIYTENFGNNKTSPEIFETASLLMRRGADLNQIRKNLYG